MARSKAGSKAGSKGRCGSSGEERREGKRERRTFTAEFKLEAVHLMRSRRAQGMSLEQIGRELDVRPDQLRAWSRKMDVRAGAKLPDVFPGNGNLPSAEDEIRRLRRELEVTRQERDFLKKRRVLREGVAVRFACIARHRDEFRVRLMCRVLDVSVSGFYASQRRPPSLHAISDQRLTLHVRMEHTKSRKRYGSPRVHVELKENGIRTNRKRVARLMRKEGIKAKRARKFCVTTNSQHEHPIALNTLDRQFDIHAVGNVNRIWAADITYIPTREGWQYLAGLSQG